MLNNPLLKGGLRPTRLIGATEEVERAGRLLSTWLSRRKIRRPKGRRAEFVKHYGN